MLRYASHLICLLSLALSVISSPSSIRPLSLNSVLVPRGISAKRDEARCFYDYGCSSECVSSPAMSGCEQSIRAVCAAVAGTPPANLASWWFYATHSPPNISPSSNVVLTAETIHNADCVALVRVAKQLQTYPTEPQCLESFSKVLDCANFSRGDFNGTCVGGSINVQFCNEDQGTLLDKGSPAYLLGTADMLNVEPSYYNGTHDLGELVGKEGVVHQEVYDGTVSGPVGPDKIREGDTGPR